MDGFDGRFNVIELFVSLACNLHDCRVHVGSPSGISVTVGYLYTPNPDGYCGDEDNGQTSAWYVFSALGFYPVCPGSGEYVLGAPLFKNTKINLENGKTITINAKDNSDANRYVGSLTLNGKNHDMNYLNHDDLKAGAELLYDMVGTPNKSRGTGIAARPYSFSREK